MNKSLLQSIEEQYILEIPNTLLAHSSSVSLLNEAVEKKKIVKPIHIVIISDTTWWLHICLGFFFWVLKKSVVIYHGFKKNKK